MQLMKTIDEMSDEKKSCLFFLSTALAFWALTTYLFASAINRLKTGPKAPAALILTCFGIYLASQCFAGILL